MRATFDFDRELGSVLRDGPSGAPDELIDQALAEARVVRQRRPFLAVLDRRAWPAPTISVGNPAIARAALLALVALLVVALAASLVAVGGPLLRRLMAAPASWSATGSLSVARDDGASLTLLADGRVLASGGGPSTTRLRSAELYDPSDGTWTVVDDMFAPRAYGSAVRLRDGQVLVSGGSGDRRSELFDPATKTWAATGEMVEARSQHAAILLPSGEVLAAGGTAGSDPSLAAELYDPEARTWRSTGAMTIWRASPSITLLQDGRVLVVQGFGAGIQLRTAETYDPSTEQWTATGFTSEFRADDQTATLLPDGTVLVFGGAGSVAEVYDPASNTFTTIPPPLARHRNGTAALLGDGSVLLAGGGLEEPAPLTFAELYDPASVTWRQTASMPAAHMGAKAVVLLDGSVLLVGGVDLAGPLASVERYFPGS